MRKLNVLFSHIKNKKEDYSNSLSTMTPKRCSVFILVLYFSPVFYSEFENVEYRVDEIRLNYRIQGKFSRYIRWGGSVAR